MLLALLVLSLFLGNSPTQANPSTPACEQTNSPDPSKDLNQLSSHCKNLDVFLPDLASGCASIKSCDLTNNGNKFKKSSKARAEFERLGGCQGSLKCPADTQLVCSKKYAVRVCMDTQLKQADGIPEGNFSYFKCQQHCLSKNRRLPTNNEWLVAASGTKAEDCLDPNAVYPIKEGASMTDLSVNKPLKTIPREKCKSLYGVQDMVGVLGQWIQERFKNKAGRDRGKFNGGLWPQDASTQFYRTIAHSPTHLDYSIGCRCASNPRNQ